MAGGGAAMSRPAMKRVAGLWEMRVNQYLAFRKGLGASIDRQGEELIHFARRLDSTGVQGPLTNALAMSWATSSPKASRRYWTVRLSAVRGFAKYLVVADARHEVPPRDLLVQRYARRPPHIYTPAEIQALMAAPHTFMRNGGLPPLTYRTLFGLLAATGMRCGEALALRREDVDLKRQRIQITHGKFGKSRVLPLHPSTVRALRYYLTQRDARFKVRRSSAFFVSRDGAALTYQRVIKTFATLRDHLGWRGHPRPRPHDLRHTFAVTNLLRWTTEGTDVDTKILALTTYLGHVDLSSTYWYFSAVPALLAVVGKRFERATEGEVGDGGHGHEAGGVAPGLLRTASEDRERRVPEDH